MFNHLFEASNQSIPVHNVAGDQLLPEQELPHPLPPFSWVELGIEHAKVVGKLIHRIESYDDPPFRTSASEIRNFYLSPDQWRSVGALDENGHLVAYAQVRLRPQRNEVLCNGGVDPNFRGLGLGQACLLWERDQARKMVDRSQLSRITFYVEDKREDLSNILVSLGYQVAARYDDWDRDLSHPVEQITVKFPLEITPWQVELDELVWRAANRLLESVGAEPITLSTWGTNRKDFDPKCSFIALDKSSDRWEVAGFALCSIYRQDWAALGTRQGYLDLLGVLPDWGHREVAPALLAQVMCALKHKGLRSVGASLSQENDNELAQIFSRAGFQRTTSLTEYSIEISANPK